MTFKKVGQFLILINFAGLVGVFIGVISPNNLPYLVASLLFCSLLIKEKVD